MSRSYYVLQNGRVKREHNTLYIENTDGVKKPLPIEDVDSLYLYGEVDLNTRLLNFLSHRKVPLHVFNYYGFYSGSYYPREYLHSGYLLVRQANHYGDPARRLALARELVRASAHSLLRNIAYYEKRKNKTGDDREPSGEVGLSLDENVPATPSSAIPTDPDTEHAIDTGLQTALAEPPGDHDEPDPFGPEPAFDFDTGAGLPDETVSNNDQEAGESHSALSLAWLRTTIEGLAAFIETVNDVDALRGIEGKMRERYYRAWPHILSDGWAFTRRVRRPPDNEINALISFGNGHLYTVCLSEIYRTQLAPTVSYLHEPGARRFSLALDLSEIFKPLIVDRAIFKLVNTGQLKASHFDKSLDGCFLTDAGKKVFLAALEDKLTTSIKHRRLGRHVSYRHLIRLECYKLVRHLTDIEPYRAFRAWW